MQVLQNKCIRFCLQFGYRQHIRTQHFGKIKWFPIDQRLKQCLFISIFKFFPEICPRYMNHFNKTNNQNNTVIRNYSLKLFQPLRTKAFSQKCLSCLGFFIWNGLVDGAKLLSNTNNFKYMVKKGFLALLRETDQAVYVYYG